MFIALVFGGKDTAREALKRYGFLRSRRAEGPDGCVPRGGTGPRQRGHVQARQQPGQPTPSCSVSRRTAGVWVVSYRFIHPVFSFTQFGRFLTVSFTQINAFDMSRAGALRPLVRLVGSASGVDADKLRPQAAESIGRIVKIHTWDNRFGASSQPPVHPIVRVPAPTPLGRAPAQALHGKQTTLGFRASGQGAHTPVRQHNERVAGPPSIMRPAVDISHSIS